MRSVMHKDSRAQTHAHTCTHLDTSTFIQTHGEGVRHEFVACNWSPHTPRHKYTHSHARACTHTHTCMCMCIHDT
jgi:hypothetical protein